MSDTRTYENLLAEAPELLVWAVSRVENSSLLEKEEAISWLLSRFKSYGDVTQETLLDQHRKQLNLPTSKLRALSKGVKPWSPNSPRAERDEVASEAKARTQQALAEHEAQNRQEQSKRVDAERLASDPSILHKAILTVEKLGVVGERKNIAILRLTFRSRATQRPVNIEVNSQSSAGKTHLVVNTLRLEPKEACYELTASSEKAFIYTDEPLEHRHIFIQEPEGLAQDVGAAIMKALIWEGRVKYDVVIKKDGEFVVQHIEKDGPTGLIITTTRPLDEQISGRMLRIEVDSSEEQTRRILDLIGREAAGEREDVNLEAWHALSTLLAEPVEVVVPYAPWLASQVRPSTVLIRRQFTHFLSLIKASAIEHRYQRKLDGQGRLLGTVADYAIVHTIASDLFTSVQEEGLTQLDREFVTAIKELSENGKNPVSQAALRGEIKASKSAVSYRVRRLMNLGFVANLQDKKGLAAKLVPGAPLPDVVPPLPSPCELTLHLINTGQRDLVHPWVNPITGEAHDCMSHQDLEKIIPDPINSPEHLNSQSGEASPRRAEVFTAPMNGSERSNADVGEVQIPMETVQVFCSVHQGGEHPSSPVNSPGECKCPGVQVQTSNDGEKPDVLEV